MGDSEVDVQALDEKEADCIREVREYIKSEAEAGRVERALILNSDFGLAEDDAA